MIKNLPAKIYLQTFCDGDEGETAFEDLADVTWCAEQINESDIGYILAQPATEPLAQQQPTSQDVRDALLFCLWHHQGGSSKIGQPIRHALGIGQHDHLTDEQLAAAKHVQSALTPPQRKPLTSKNTTFAQRFTDAVAILCGSEPPTDFVDEWLGNVDVNGVHRLQEWVLNQAATPPWAQGIVVLDAAHLLAESPEEGEQHKERPKPTNEQLDAEFSAYAAQFDTLGDEWQDMGAGDYFKAGFMAAHNAKGAA